MGEIGETNISKEIRIEYISWLKFEDIEIKKGRITT